MSYIEKLRDPRWQRKRLEILNEDKWTCQECRATDKPLHVDHTYYERGKEPWEYENHTLITLCENCHAKITELRKDVTFGMQFMKIEDARAVIDFMKGRLRERLNRMGIK